MLGAHQMLQKRAIAAANVKDARAWSDHFRNRGKVRPQCRRY
jgi:hypothetical protein